MTTPSALGRPLPVPLGRRSSARLAVVLAKLIAKLPPRRIKALLRVLRRGARPASYEQAKSARDAVLAVSLTCRGPQGCLPRSLAAAVLCRFGGTWPTWCAGVRMKPPFGAHAWIEAEDRLVDEGAPSGYFGRLLAVGPPE
ncbi:lasso peptide biosynthesis B2 protein [Amycolatopsis sp. NPDC058986]|uniref:lasso peptide biosynthesis B2 protein n=1 Tax=unclassified Amycolatopsis TaxID=2618356 RepID=UPI00366E5546